MVERRSPKPSVEVRFLVGPPKRKTAGRRSSALLLLHFLESLALPGDRIELRELELSLHLLLILAREDHVLRGLRAQLYEIRL